MKDIEFIKPKIRIKKVMISDVLVYSNIKREAKLIFKSKAKPRIMSNSSDEIQTDSFSEPLFPKLRNDISIKTKLLITAKRHKHNYFLNMDEITDDGSIHEKCVPNRFVTQEELEKWLNKNQRCLNKKICWAIEHMDEDYLASFKSKLENFEFTSVSSAAKYVAEIYAKQCKNFQSTKSRIVDNDGSKIKKDKKIDELISYKSCLFASFKSELYGELIDILKLSAITSKTNVSGESASLMFARQCVPENGTELSTHHARIAVAIIEKIHSFVLRE